MLMGRLCCGYIDRMRRPFSPAELAEALRTAVLDSLAGAPPPDPAPNIDLAVLVLPAVGATGAAPVAANLHFSREFPQGRVADIAAGFGAVRGLHFLADARGPDGTSLAWIAGSDWTQLPASTFAPLAGAGEARFIAPYPASLLKLMVLVGVARLVDQGRTDWDESWPFAQASGALAPTVAQWCEPMIVTSSNEATSALVALLHNRGAIRRSGWRVGQPDSGRESHNELHTLFEAQGLATLRLADTKPDGGWFNRDGAGVGRLQMTAWDTVRLLWRLLAEQAPPAPWLPADAPPLLGADSRARIWGWLQGQALHERPQADDIRRPPPEGNKQSGQATFACEVLSSTLLAGMAGWQRGIPARLPARWLTADGAVLAAGRRYAADVRPASAAADAVFLHKTGSTASYASDAGLVVGDGGRRYLIALLSTLGSRHAPQPGLASPWSLPRLGAAIDAWLKARIE